MTLEAGGEMRFEKDRTFFIIKKWNSSENLQNAQKLNKKTKIGGVCCINFGGLILVNSEDKNTGISILKFRKIYLLNLFRSKF